MSRLDSANARIQNYGCTVQKQMTRIQNYLATLNIRKWNLPIIGMSHLEIECTSATYINCIIQIMERNCYFVFVACKKQLGLSQLAGKQLQNDVSDFPIGHLEKPPPFGIFVIQSGVGDFHWV